MAGKVMLVLAALTVAGLAFGLWRKTHDGPQMRPVATDASGINLQGDVVGSFGNVTGPEHGFLLHRGTFTPIEDSKAGTQYLQGTAAEGINLQGDIVGYSTDNAGIGYGFLLHKGTYTSVVWH